MKKYLFFYIISASIFLSVFVFLKNYFKPVVLAQTGNAYYVDYETGNNSNSGTSQSAPWRHSPGMAGATGAAASTALQPGDIVYFKKGVTWPSAALPLTPGQSGTSASSITYMAKADWGTGSYAIFDGENANTHAFNLDNYNNRQYLIVDGLWMRNTTGSAYFNRSSSNQVVRNIKISGVAITESTSFYASRRTTLENCVIDGNGSWYAVEMTYDVGHVVRNCELYNTQTGVRVASNSHNGIIEKNYIHNIIAGGSNMPWAIIYRSSNTGTIRYNIVDVRGASGDVRAITSWTGGSTYTGHKIYNNVLIGEGVGAGFSSPASDYDGFYFANNIFYDFVDCIDSPSDATISNNDFYSCGTNWGGGGSFTISNNITSNPTLVNINSLPGGAALQSGSPAINTGISYDGYHNGVNADYAGTIVPQASIPDIGAFEYASGGSPDITAPSIPTNLTATPISSSQINLSWTASTDDIGVAGYRVYRNGTQITDITATSYQSTGLSPSTAYSYTVSAYDAANNESNQSSSVLSSTPTPLKGDFNSDSKVNNLDFASFKNALKSIFNSIFDLNSDSAIDVRDLGVLMSNWLP